MFKKVYSTQSFITNFFHSIHLLIMMNQDPRLLRKKQLALVCQQEKQEFKREQEFSDTLCSFLWNRLFRFTLYC